MKKVLFLVLVLFAPLLIIAQQQPTLIKVRGHAVHIGSKPVFKAKISLSGNYSSLPAEMLTLDKLEKQYKTALEAKGISWKNLIKDPYEFGFESMGFDKEGILYEYQTKSIKKMKNFLDVKSLGMQVLSYVCIITIDEEAALTLSKKALDKAKERATTLAHAMGKQLGEIQEIIDLNSLSWGEEVESILFYDRPVGEFQYRINVIFTAK